MSKKKSRIQQARTLRIFRKIHRSMGAFLFVFFFIVSISGILLGVKKDSAGLLLPVTQQGTSSNLKDWKDLAQLQLIAQTALKDVIYCVIYGYVLFFYVQLYISY